MFLFLIFGLFVTVFSQEYGYPAVPTKLQIEKWTIGFKLHDINRDGVISSADYYTLKQSFLATYEPEASQREKMIKELRQFWTKQIFLTNEQNWDKVFTVNDFIATRFESYRRDRSLTLSLNRQSIEHIFRAGDVNKLGYFNLDAYRKFKDAYGMRDPTLQKILFGLISEGSPTITASSIAKFYTELVFGTDEVKHEKYKAALGGFL